VSDAGAGAAPGGALGPGGAGGPGGALGLGGAANVPGAGLCNACRHQQVVTTTRGSAFSLCRRSREEPERFARYPRIPVTACPGFEPHAG
jgi:hypothetical protein